MNGQDKIAGEQESGILISQQIQGIVKEKERVDAFIRDLEKDDKVVRKLIKDTEAISNFMITGKNAIEGKKCIEDCTEFIDTFRVESTTELADANMQDRAPFWGLMEGLLADGSLSDNEVQTNTPNDAKDGVESITKLADENIQDRDSFLGLIEGFLADGTLLGNEVQTNQHNDA